MLNDKELISKLRQLRDIKPRQEWVFLAKQKILNSEEKTQSFSFGDIIAGVKIILQHKYALSSVMTLAILLGMFGFAQNSLPGDLLFPVRKITEQTQSALTSQEAQPKRSFEIANKRLEDLEKIAQQNTTKNLASAINEYQASVSEAAKNLASKVSANNKEEVKQIVQEVKKLEERVKQVKALGVELGESSNELENALAEMVQEEINSLEGKLLTDGQKGIFDDAKKDYEAGNYSEALEEILTINPVK